MTDYGAPPAQDEIEVTLFGPGYGESIAIHLGEGVWLLVDSCIDPATKGPASEKYLDQMGVGVEQVRTIVASHWHDDHVRGISRLAAKYPTAEFLISTALSDKEAATFLAAYGGGASPGLARGANELFSVIKERETVSHVHHRSIVFEAQLNGRHVIVTALSPVQASIDQFISHIVQYLPRNDKPINHAPELRTNIAAVALHIDLGDDAVLLGADLEEHETCGWSAVVGDSWSGARRQATAYKVAHHGSHSGDCQDVWSTLLKPAPIACLTPFTLGNLRLPEEKDKIRLKRNTPHTYISSGASRSPEMDRGQLKRLSDICKNLARVDAGFGAVRLRKPISAPSWKVELFGAAQAL